MPLIFLQNILINSILICTLFDLRGFGSNIDNGTWVDPRLHEKDIIEFIDIIINKNMGKKIFFYLVKVWGEY